MFYLVLLLKGISFRREALNEEALVPLNDKLPIYLLFVCIKYNIFQSDLYILYEYV